MEKKEIWNETGNIMKKVLPIFYSGIACLLTQTIFLMGFAGNNPFKLNKMDKITGA